MSLLLAPLAGVASSPSTAQPQIQALLAEQMVAANAHDTDRFLASYLHGPELVFLLDGLTPSPTVIHGFAGLRTQQLKWWQKTDAIYRADGPVQFQPIGPDAEIVTEPLAAHRTSPGGQAVDSHFVITMVWKRTPAGWRVLYAHESWMH
jgi:ketosteroid isomerase-like protein